MADLINTLETPGEFDAMTSLREGEPYFLLIGRDEFAPQLVQQWAELNRKRALGKRSIKKDKLNAELRKSTEAEQIGWAMTAYRRGYKELAPTDTPRATYTDFKLPADAAKRDAERSARVRTVSAINNAIGEIAELQRDIGGEQFEPLMKALEAQAVIIMPARPVGKSA